MPSPLMGEDSGEGVKRSLHLNVGTALRASALSWLLLTAAGLLSACSSDGAATSTPRGASVLTPVLTIAPAVRTKVAAVQTATEVVSRATRASAVASAAPGVRTALPGIVRGATGSTSSVLLPDGRVRTYFISGGSLSFAESEDGTSLSELTGTSVAGGRAPGSLGAV